MDAPAFILAKPPIPRLALATVDICPEILATALRLTFAAATRRPSALNAAFADLEAEPFALKRLPAVSAAAARLDDELAAETEAPAARAALPARPELALARTAISASKRASASMEKRG
jgi:hypothetical protein